MESAVVLRVEFQSEGTRCAADLYLPSNSSVSGRPALVLATGFAGVKESSADAGRFFASAGYPSLAIDYRTFGASEGQPRGQAFPLREVEDVRNAVTYLENRPEVDANRIAIWGTSFGGGIVLYAGALDRRIKLVMSQIPVVDGRIWHETLRSSEQYARLLDALDEDRRCRYLGHPSRRVPVTGLTDRGGDVAMPADQEIVEMLAAAPLSMPTWSAEVTLESVEKALEFSPESVIDRISPRPLLITAVTGRDIIHPVRDVIRAYSKAGEPKQLLLLPYDQLGLYGGPGLQEALGQQLQFLSTHLPVDGKKGRTIA